MTPIQLGPSPYGVPAIVILAVVSVVALAAGVLLRIRRESSRPTGHDWSAGDPPVSADVPVTEASEDESDDARPAGTEDSQPDLLETASERYDRGEYGRSVQAVYMDVRMRLADELDVSMDGTHWDFFERCTEEGLTGRREPLRALTETYERAAFGSRSTTADDAATAFELATELTEATVPGRP